MSEWVKRSTVRKGNHYRYNVAPPDIVDVGNADDDLND